MGGCQRQKNDAYDPIGDRVLPKVQSGILIVHFCPFIIIPGNT
jgi:hypothetical protein